MIGVAEMTEVQITKGAVTAGLVNGAINGVIQWFLL